ncbi:hypothetical protein, partial [Providencia alcalifaciens]|uniref:hypothetical protein n=1 Tax=Providencia alcalifaciens TaxID=126385 RepID=UPI001E61979C
FLLSSLFSCCTLPFIDSSILIHDLVILILSPYTTQNNIDKDLRFYRQGINNHHFVYLTTGWSFF